MCKKGEEIKINEKERLNHDENNKEPASEQEALVQMLSVKMISLQTSLVWSYISDSLSHHVCAVLGRT